MLTVYTWAASARSFCGVWSTVQACMRTTGPQDGEADMRHSLVNASLMVGECGLSEALFGLRLSGSAFTPCKHSLSH